MYRRLGIDEIRYQILDELRSVTSHVNNRLKDVHLTVLDHLLDASVCREVNPSA